MSKVLLLLKEFIIRMVKFSSVVSSTVQIRFSSMQHQLLLRALCSTTGSLFKTNSFMVYYQKYNFFNIVEPDHLNGSVEFYYSAERGVISKNMFPSCNVVKKPKNNCHTFLFCKILLYTHCRGEYQCAKKIYLTNHFRPILLLTIIC